MTDYGHDLQFGVFITPAADRAAEVLELARLADVLGLDLVTFQDHPYQATFLDTWTLLVGRRRPDDERARRPERRQPAAAPAGRAGPQRGEPRPAQRRPRRARPRRRRVLGRDRGQRRRAAHARPGRRRARRGDRRDPRDLGDGRRPVHHRRRALLRRRRRTPGPRPSTTSRSGSAPTSRGCSRSPARQADGWLPSIGYVELDAAAGDERRDRRVGGRGRPRPDEIRRLLQHQRDVRSGGRVPAGRPRDWAEQLAELTLDDRDVSAYILSVDLRRRCPALRRGGRARGAGARRGRARERRARAGCGPARPAVGQRRRRR